jgi:hypothetical protein
MSKFAELAATVEAGDTKKARAIIGEMNFKEQAEAMAAASSLQSTLESGNPTPTSENVADGLLLEVNDLVYSYLNGDRPMLATYVVEEIRRIVAPAPTPEVPTE